METIWSQERDPVKGAAAAEKGKWSHSGIAQHKEKCDAAVNWEPKFVKSMSNKNKKCQIYNLKIR